MDITTSKAPPSFEPSHALWFETSDHSSPPSVFGCWFWGLDVAWRGVCFGGFRCRPQRVALQVLARIPGGALPGAGRVYGATIHLTEADNGDYNQDLRVHAITSSTSFATSRSIRTFPATASAWTWKSQVLNCEKKGHREMMTKTLGR